MFRCGTEGLGCGVKEDPVVGSIRRVRRGCLLRLRRAGSFEKDAKDAAPGGGSISLQHASSRSPALFTSGARDLACGGPNSANVPNLTQVIPARSLTRLKSAEFRHDAFLVEVSIWNVLLCWYQIKFAGRFLVEQRAFFLVSAAPVFVPTGNANEIARTYSLLTILVLV